VPYLILLFLALFLLGAYIVALGFLLFLIATFAIVPLVAIAAVGAYAVAAILPLILLVNKGLSGIDGDLATPAEVVGGRVLGARPSGEMAAHGWDPAWPLYFPYQAKRDFKAVAAWMIGFNLAALKLPWRWVSALWLRSKGFSRWLWWVPVIVFMIPTVALPITLFAVLETLAGAIFIGLLWLVMTATTYLARAGGAAYGATERSSRRRASKELVCPTCYRTTLTPGYLCATCGRAHRLLQPGPLGILTRTCECGSRLPTTATRAAKAHLEVVCPYCDGQLSATAGARPTVLIPVVGPVGAGKTTFFASAVVGMQDYALGAGGAFEPTNPAATQFASLASTAELLPKTAFAGRPEVMTFEASRGGSTHDIQLVDAAGEFFVDWESAQALTYIDSATGWVFVIDPLMLPEVRDVIERNGVDLGQTIVGTGDIGGAYASVVDRFKASGGRLKDKALAVVVSKADLLVQVPEWSQLREASAVRQLLFNHGADNLLRGAELDFEKISYFAVESRDREALDPSRDPVRVIDWALAQKRLKLSFMPVAAQPAPVEDAAAHHDPIVPTK
tara:strand:- start:1139 stop:2824 length:1686 start_codon:yes stop_codon:yes gene_type:complete